MRGVTGFSTTTTTVPATEVASGGYSDVAGSTHEEHIGALAADGVLDRTECGDDLFCPGDALERWTMAVWIVRVLDGEEPPAAASTRFPDVDASMWWAAHVERFAELGVTHGYGDGTFRPHQDVTRAQMAAFLERAFDLPPAGDAGFSDITADTFHRDDINALAASGITSGYGDGTFRPHRPTTRAQMAAFINRALTADTADAALEYQAGDTIAGFPSGFSAASGNFSRASVSVTGGGSTVTVTMSHSGTAAYAATTYTCTSTGGCTIVNGRVTTGTVNATATNTDEANRPPRFTSPATLTAHENTTAAGTVTAVDDDTADTVTGYTITGGADRSRLSITNGGQLSFNTAPDYEHPADSGRNNAYQVTVTATSGRGARATTATQDVTVTITDIAEAPSAPAAPTATSTTDTTITLTWSEPANTGPAINDYDIQYRRRGTTAWTDWPHTGTARTATITGLTANTTYNTQTRATNPEATSRWSTTTSTTTTEAETTTTVPTTDDLFEGEITQCEGERTFSGRVDVIIGGTMTAKRAINAQFLELFLTSILAEVDAPGPILTSWYPHRPGPGIERAYF